MKLLSESLSIKEAQKKYSHFFDTMAKIVVDISLERIAIDAELHADLEQLLLENGSRQQDLWGANIYFSKPEDIEFTALINIRPAQNNRGMEIKDPKIRNKITQIVNKMITK